MSSVITGGSAWLLSPPPGNRCVIEPTWELSHSSHLEMETHLSSCCATIAIRAEGRGVGVKRSCNLVVGNHTINEL